MKRNILFALVLTGYVMGAHADDEVKPVGQTDNTSTINVNAGAAAPIKDIDDEITNARMRATLGSKNRYSFKSALNYNGGSVTNPMAEVRPNYLSSNSKPIFAQIGGTVSINYRLTERDNLTLSTGLTIVDPFHGGIDKPVIDSRKGATYGKSVERYQLSSPSFGWSRGYKALGAQMISDATMYYASDSDSHDANAYGDIVLSQTVLANLGDSKWQLGATGSFDYSVYGGDVKNSVQPDYVSGDSKRDDLSVGLYPFVEYSFTDRYSFRTLFGYFVFNKYRDEYGNNTNLRQVEPYQSVGLGISVTRDIYLYPNIQFAPKDLKADRTNVALSTNINI